ncbi:NADH-quinone oxidoreductase subunit NuoB [Alicyclobacillus shizuokensis]|uniref:NADH-quinone oxidoreductase subunit NuoB n=1 Tax=Alicyclobacillus shizuokensis TaxID=392014 RepID=UPI00082BBD88|nr:NADH-quinone oxidoreductase subunit NuoB [Alicyclobacillus shizuokensis]MCL6625277.1 NADH-quinone oxidoreductase subunit NuoB [Alicyclobacillus shizuokensis]
MLANWLRAGIASGRITTKYPRNAAELTQRHPAWQTVATETRACGRESCSCIDLCPTGAIAFDTTHAPVVNALACIGCGRCVEGCPEGIFAWSKQIDLSIPADNEWSGSQRQAGVLADGSVAANADTIASGTRSDRGTLEEEACPDWNAVDSATLRRFRAVFGRSLNVRHIDVGSCNACESEVLALSNPYYNFHRLGIFFTASPRHADVLLVTGALTYAMRDVLLATYEAMPRPRLVVAAGVCALHGGVFQDSEQFVGPIDKVIPVDVFIPGCPPTPYALINGLLQAAARRGEAVAHA